MANELLMAIACVFVGGVIGIIAMWIVIGYQNKRWIFTPAIETRTKAILNAYNQFLKAYFKINTAANIGEDSTTFTENIEQPIKDYSIAVENIGIWVSEKSSEELRDIQGVFENFMYGIWNGKGESPTLKKEDWKAFTRSLDKMKRIVSEEIAWNKIFLRKGF